MLPFPALQMCCSSMPACGRARQRCLRGNADTQPTTSDGHRQQLRQCTGFVINCQHFHYQLYKWSHIFVLIITTCTKATVTRNVQFVSFASTYLLLEERHQLIERSLLVGQDAEQDDQLGLHRCITDHPR